MCIKKEIMRFRKIHFVEQYDNVIWMRFLEKKSNVDFTL